MTCSTFCRLGHWGLWRLRNTADCWWIQDSNLVRLVPEILALLHIQDCIGDNYISGEKKQAKFHSKLSGGGCRSVTQSCPSLHEPMDCSTPGFPVLHHLLEFDQTHVHWVSDAIQPSHLLSPPSPALNLSQHQGLFTESVLHIRWPKYWSFSSTSVLPTNIQSWFPLGLTSLISLQSRRMLKKGFSSTIWKH